MAKNYSTWGWAGSGYGERIFLEIWHSGFNIAGNYSNFGYKIYNNSYNSYGNTGTVRWSLSDQWGQRASGSLSDSQATSTNYYQVTDYSSGSFRINHNPDGSIPNVNFKLNISRELGNITSTTVSVTLYNIPTIPRHSNATISSSFTLGNSFNVKFNRASSSFWHWIDVKYGSTMLYSEKIYEDSVSIMIDRNRVLDLVSNSNSTSLTIVYTTRTSAGTEIGRSTRSITCNLNAPSPRIGNITHSEYVDLVKQIGAYVQSKSRLKIAVTGAVPGRGASIRNYRITVDGQVLNAASGVTQPISQSGNIPIVATITDSRGKQASKTISVNVMHYEPPKISSLKVFRASSSGEEDDYGTYVKFDVGYRITPFNANNLKKIRIKAGSHDNTVNLNSYDRVYSDLLSGFDVNNTYTYTIEIHDLFGKTVTTAVIPTGAVTMLWGRDSISVGTAKMMGPGTINTREQMYQNGGIAVANGLIGPLPPGDLLTVDYWMKMEDGVWFANANDAVKNKPFNWGILQKRSANPAPGIGSSIFEVVAIEHIRNTSASANIWVLTGNAQGVSAWSKMMTLRPNEKIGDYILDSKLTSDGYWEKWASGKLFQSGKAIRNFTVQTGWGGWYIGTNRDLIGFPIPFISEPDVTYNLLSTTTNSFMETQYIRTIIGTHNFGQFTVMRPTQSTSVQAEINWHAIGRWK